MSSPAAAWSAALPWPAVSATSNAKPPSVPMPRTDGGGSTMICASLISASRFWASARMRGSESPDFTRSSNGFERAEDRAGVGGVGLRRAGEAGERDGARDAGRVEKDLRGALHDGVGAFERGAIGQLDHGDDVRLVGLRDEARRHDAEHRAGEHQQTDVAHEHDHRQANRPAHAAGIGVRRERERAVEEAEEPAEREVPQPREPVLLRAVRREHQRAQRRAERERVERGDDRRDGDGDRELAVELAGDAADERRRDEHRRQHQGDGDDRAADFVHRLARGVARRLAQLQVPLDVLDHHDRVIHDDADREHEAEQREIVEREAQRRQHGERADERHGNRDQRDDRRAPVLQEHDHDEHDQQHGLEDGLLHRGDRLLDELRRVVADLALEPGGKALAQLVQRRLDRARPWRSRSSPGAGRCTIADRGAGRCRSCWCCSRAPPSSTRAMSCTRTTRPSVAALDDDVAELLGIDEAALRVDDDLEVLARGHRRLRRAGPRPPARSACAAPRRPPARSGRSACDSLGIEPDAHAVLARAEDAARRRRPRRAPAHPASAGSRSC